MKLLEALRQREPAAAERLVTTHGDRAYRLATRITGNEQDAEEIVQDAFWSVVQKIDSFRAESAFGSWLFRGCQTTGPSYTATASVFYAHELGLVPITTPAYSPESNGLAEGFVHAFKRDYVNVHELRDAESVLAQLAAWIDDCNRLAPHSALGMRSPAEYRARTSPPKTTTRQN